jgi:hypothetical protein
MYPSVVVGTTAMLREYAPAVEGMAQELSGITKLRSVWAATDGPPNEPSALRVSTMRQGVTGVKCIALEIVGGEFPVTVRVT